MASQNPRPELTRTQKLRQTRPATLVKEYEQKQEIGRPQQAIDPGRRHRYPVSEPKRVEFTKPAMTKAMIARMKHAEKAKQELGREKISARRIPSPPRARRGAVPRRREPEALRAIPERTKELARSINAEVIQAEPVGEGPIDSIVIPPRTVSENRTIIVSIPQPPTVSVDAPASQIANRSIQVISETLDEQDAAEVATVQSKLEDLQQARRDFVIAVANVGGNAVQLAEEEKSRYIYKVPDIESEMFRIEYGREHPSVVAAREFAQRSMAGIRDRERARRVEEEFERMIEDPFLEDLRFDVPFEEEFPYEVDISWEEEDLPYLSRRASMRNIPVREVPYRYPPFDPEQLERFFDVE
ncbi:hypothetical protein DMN91_007568 [Ooceraea biroi]|uniref:Uncharacterized protein n=1 Tax=Ooceraea biroi TaxID=2015173 RepID=A0A3L8DL79_OOCBI|nr:hypothetical protein DMN91_007568 [Ooceraea biroi]